VFVQRFFGLPGIGWLLIASILWCALATSTSWADAQTDRLKSNARDQLLKPYRKAPYSCTGPAVSGKDNYVVEVTPWAAAAGLRRGDRVTAYGGTSLTGIEDSDIELWAKISRAEYVDFRIERAGKEIELRIPCRDDRARWDVYVALGQAVAEGRWQDCIDAASRVVTVTGMASSGSLHVAVLCMLEKAKAERQPPPAEYWRRLHAWATKAIEESRYRPAGLAEIRGRLLNATEVLEKAGRNTLADDIKQQLATFNQTPSATETRAESKAIQHVGTAFVVRPDGLLLTAFHVVKGAKEIEISCPESGQVKAWVEKFSEANDIAVLRLASGRTPTYLSIGDLKSVALGEQVFTIGFPAPSMLGGEAKFTEGVISSLSVGGDAGYMQISVPVQPGNSGGPLVNRSGEVVGVVVASASALSFLKGTGALPQNVSWAVKGTFAVPLFDAPPRSPRVSERRTAVDRALKATCFVTASEDPNR
jgi:S1-C subfamily serine protease